MRRAETGLALPDSVRIFQQQNALGTAFTKSRFKAMLPGNCAKPHEAGLRVQTRNPPGRTEDFPAGCLHMQNT
ncbi:MAG: hypothetical protein DBY37_09140 [Desulfovibrionaceae bacterium]|nr:MAG: hypothetical protein DBY37_09140 [Desulfovibrionaceae bacterium]